MHCKKEYGGYFMRQFTIELDEMTCIWLEHISQLKNEPIEKLIAKGVSNRILKLEDEAFKFFE